MRKAFLIALSFTAGCGGPRPRGFAQCAVPDASGLSIVDAINQYPMLYQWCLMDTEGGAPVYNEKTVPYDLTTPLFSDYALKDRLVYLPAGTSATYAPDQPFEFPVGTVLIKSFSFAPDLRAPSTGKKLVETRLLVRNSSEWISLPYVWDDAQMEATLKVGGAFATESFIDPAGDNLTAHYLIPQSNQCGQCHDVGIVQSPIGPKARTLNRDYAYDSGSENQLAHWTRLGILQGAPTPDQAPKLPVWDDPTTGSVADRARAWLEGNCAHCHSEQGLSRTTGLYLSSLVTDPAQYGVCKTPVAAGEGSGGLLYDIVPGHPEASILVHRIQSVVPSIMMPEIGRSVVHAEGVALIQEWITEMSGTCN